MRSYSGVPLGTPSRDAEQMRLVVTSRSSVMTLRATADLMEEEEGVCEQEIVQAAPVGADNYHGRLRAAGIRDVAGRGVRRPSLRSW